MSPLFSIASSVAGGIFKALRNSGDADSASIEPSVKLTGFHPGSAGNVGIGAAEGSFAARFRTHMAKITDADGDGAISHDELARQLARGGASATEADRQYQAMDKNGDGQVSVDEFKDATAVPASPLVRHVLNMIEARRAASGTPSV